MFLITPLISNLIIPVLGNSSWRVMFGLKAAMSAAMQDFAYYLVDIK